MICDTCKKETSEVYEIQGYLGTYSLCDSCFHGEEEEDDDER